MTLDKFTKLFNQYKKDYDFRLKKISYEELENLNAHDGEFLPD